MTHDPVRLFSPVIGNAGSNHEAIVLYQQDHILPEALPYFDSLWIADHFYGFDARTDLFLEAWTTTWLEQVPRRHPVPPRPRSWLPAPSTHRQDGGALQVLTGGRFVLGIGAGWRGDEYEARLRLPQAVGALRQLEELIHICRLMWSEDIRPSMANTSASATKAPVRTRCPASASGRPA